MKRQHRQKEFTRRRSRRYEMHCPATITSANNEVFHARIVDSGTGGLGLATCMPLVVGQMIEVNIKNFGEFKCRVEWFHMERCGISFLPESGALSSEQIAELVSAIDFSPPS